MTTDDRTNSVRQFNSGVIVCLGLTSTGLLLARGLDAPALSAEMMLVYGGIISVVLALLLAANARNRVIALVLRSELDGLTERSRSWPGSGASAPVPAPRLPRSRLMPAWITLVLGCAATFLLSRYGDVGIWLTDSPTALAAGLAGMMIWTLVGTGVAHGGRAERLRADCAVATLKLEIEALRGDMEVARVAHAEEVTRADSKLESQTQACLRLRGDLEASELAHRGTKEELASTRGELASSVADLAEIGEASARLDGENRRQDRLIEKLRGQIQTMEVDETTLRAELERTDDELAKSNIRLEKARRLESELRTKLSRLTAHAQTLEEHLVAARATGEESSSELREAASAGRGPDASSAPAAPATAPVVPPAASPGPAPAVIAPPPAEPRSRPAHVSGSLPIGSSSADSPAGRAGPGSALRVSTPPVTPSVPVAPGYVEPARSSNASYSGLRSAGDTARTPDRLPRLPIELLECNLGEIVELGRTDMRLECPQTLEGRMTVVLPVGKTKLRVEADVVSCERVARRKHDIVLRFVGLRPEIGQQILQIAMTHRRRSVLPINSIATD